MNKAFNKEFIKTLLELCVECENNDTDNCAVEIPIKEETLVVSIGFELKGEKEDE